MSKTFKNWGSLKSAMVKSAQEAVDSTVKRTYKELQENVEYFYTVPEGDYHRTGQLKDSPTIDAITNTSNGAIGQVSINTGTQYDPAGRDTEWIYRAAENDGLIGRGGFWRATEAVAENILDEEVRKRFG